MMVVVFGCAQDDPEPVSPLIGKWQSFKKSVTDCDDPKLDIADHSCPECSHFEFAQTSFTLIEGGNNFSGAYALKGDTVLMPSMAGTQYPQLAKQVFKINGGQLVLSYKSQTTLRAGCWTNMTYQKQ